MSSSGSQAVKRHKLRCAVVKCEISDDDDDGSSGLNSDQGRVVNELLRDAAPDGTIRQDKSHWRTWCKACDEAMENEGAQNREAAQEGEVQNGVCYLGDKQEHEAEVQG